jgi:hypothetical protein
VAGLHVHAGLEMRLKLGLAKLVNFFDEVTNVTKEIWRISVITIL